MEIRDNRGMVNEAFGVEAEAHGLRGVCGVAAFEPVYSSLLPSQQGVLRRLCGGRFQGLMEAGSVVSIAYAYPDHAIEAIAARRGNGYDKEAWNEYALWYRRLNEALDETAARLAGETEGIAIPATMTGVAERVEHVEDFYATAVSHRVPAERAGVGWRGRNELIVNPRYSCAVRLASVVTLLPLETTTVQYEGCGGCRACLEACPFLSQKERLSNYREQCRRYIIALGLESEVCGKCIKACVDSELFRKKQVSGPQPSADSVYYTP